jgi:hypothetical protein
MKSIPDFEYQKVDSQNLDDSEWLSIEEVVALTAIFYNCKPSVR